MSMHNTLAYLYIFIYAMYTDVYFVQLFYTLDMHACMPSYIITFIIL